MLLDQSTRTKTKVNQLLTYTALTSHSFIATTTTCSYFTSELQ